MSDTAECPDCNGMGGIIAMVDGTRNGRRWGSRQRIACGTCTGDGTISRERMEWIAEGRRLRGLRMARGMDVKQAADALNIELRTLLSSEQGRIAPALLAQAAKVKGWS